MWIEVTHLNVTEATKDRPTANIPLSGENVKDFSLRSLSREGYPVSSFLFNIALEVLARVIRQDKDMKGIQIKKK